MGKREIFIQVAEIQTMTLPGKQGYFLMSFEGWNSDKDETAIFHVEFDFAEFYSWIKEEDLKKMKKAYIEKFLKE